MTPHPIEPVLLVEDKPHILSILTTALAAGGIAAVDVASGGAEAIRRLQGRRYGLVVCERFMQPISGIDLKTLMNARKDWARIPFVCLLSSDRDGDAAKREAAGIRQCLSFPPTPDTLDQAIRAAQRQHEMA